MSSEWRPSTVEELAAPAPSALATGPFGSSISAKYFVKSGVPVLRGSNLSADVGMRLNDDGLVFVSEEKAREFQRSIAERGDLVFTCWGTINQVGLIDASSRYPRYVVSNKQMKLTVDPKKADSLFLYYVFSGPDKQAEILDNGIGSSVPGFNLGQLKRHALMLPPLAEQRQIAATLAAFDDRIALLRETNSTLETIAQALFRSWFVDFDPVRAKSQGLAPVGMDEATAALFPDGFDESERGPVPQGWRWVSLRDVVAILDSKRIPLSGQDRAKRRGLYPYYGAAALMDHVDDYIFDGIHVLVGEDGSVTQPDGMPVLQYVWGKFWVNNHAHVLQGVKGICTEHLLLALRATNIQHLVTGAVQAKLSQGNMWRIDFMRPSAEVATAFASVIEPLFARYRQNVEQVESLAAIRDTLLPRLISGQLRLPAVADAEAIA